MKRHLKSICVMTALFPVLALQAQEGNITLTANIGAVCNLQAATGVTNGAFTSSITGLNASVGFAPSTDFADAASTTVTYSAVQNVRCTYQLETTRGGMKHNDSTRRDYTAVIDDQTFTSPILSTNGTGGASIFLDSHISANPKTIEIHINFAEAPSGFTPSQGEYKDTLILTVSPTT